MKKPMHELRNLPSYFIDQTNNRGRRRLVVGPHNKGPWIGKWAHDTSECQHVRPKRLLLGCCKSCVDVCCTAAVSAQCLRIEAAVLYHGSLSWVLNTVTSCKLVRKLLQGQGPAF